MDVSENKQLLDIPKEPCCVDMTISSRKIKGKRKKKSLLLDINFFLEPKKLRLGEVTVGLKKCKLALTIENGRMPLRERGLKTALQMQVVVRRTKSGVSKHTTLAEKSVDGKVMKRSSSMTGRAKSGISKEQSGGITDEYEVIETPISAGGYEASPFWDFRAIAGHEFLEGEILDEALGNVVIAERPCKVTAVLTTRPRDLRISGSKGIWPNDMNKSNKAVRQLVIWRWLSSKVEPSLNFQSIEL